MAILKFSQPNRPDNFIQARNLNFVASKANTVFLDSVLYSLDIPAYGKVL